MFPSENRIIDTARGAPVAANDSDLGRANVPREKSQRDPTALPTGDHRELTGNSWMTGLGGPPDEEESVVSQFDEPLDENESEDDDEADGVQSIQGFFMGDRASANDRLRAIVGARFTAARTLSGLSQVEGAHAIGYQNSTQLSLIEQGRRLPPHGIVLRAAVVYSVSIDYLYGAAHDPDRDPTEAARRASLRYVRDLIERSTHSISDAVQAHARADSQAQMASLPLLGSIDEMVTAVRRFRELNAVEFDDALRGGARLLRVAETLEQHAELARQQRRRHERGLEEALARAQATASPAATVPTEVAGLQQLAPGLALARRMKGKHGKKRPASARAARKSLAERIGASLGRTSGRKKRA